MTKPNNAKERGLLIGAIRRVFSRSELRRLVLDKAVVEGYTDATRPRVTKWAKCQYCGKMEPKYLMQVDHYSPLIPLDKTRDDMTWDEIIDRAWCDETNLKPSCKPCHLLKSKQENKERRLFKKGLK